MWIWFSWKLKIRINFPFRLRFLLGIAGVRAAAVAVVAGWLTAVRRRTLSPETYLFSSLSRWEDGWAMAAMFSDSVKTVYAPIVLSCTCMHRYHGLWLARTCTNSINGVHTHRAPLSPHSRHSHIECIACLTTMRGGSYIIRICMVYWAWRFITMAHVPASRWIVCFHRRVCIFSPTHNRFDKKGRL